VPARAQFYSRYRRRHLTSRNGERFSTC
jgi:hypothetical protein